MAPGKYNIVLYVVFFQKKVESVAVSTKNAKSISQLIAITSYYLFPATGVYRTEYPDIYFVKTNSGKKVVAVVEYVREEQEIVFTSL